MKTLSKIYIVLLSLLACSTFSCKKEPAPISVSPKNAALSSSTYGQVSTRFLFVLAYGLAVDAASNLYVADGQPGRLLKITPETGVNPWPYTNPDFLSRNVEDLTFGPDSALYFADPLFHLVKRVTQSGVVTTVAGKLGVAYPTDGPDSVATFDFPQQITSCADGNLYITDSNSIRVITPGTSGIVYTLYKADKPGAIMPFGIAIHQGIVYFSDNSNTIAKIALDGTVSTFATGIAAYALAFDSSGNLYASDSIRNKVFKITHDGVVSLLAGNGEARSHDGVGASAALFQPAGLAVQGDNLYVGCVGAGVGTIMEISLK